MLRSAASLATVSSTSELLPEPEGQRSPSLRLAVSSARCSRGCSRPHPPPRWPVSCRLEQGVQHGYRARIEVAREPAKANGARAPVVEGAAIRHEELLSAGQIDRTRYRQRCFVNRGEALFEVRRIVLETLLTGTKRFWMKTDLTPIGNSSRPTTGRGVIDHRDMVLGQQTQGSPCAAAFEGVKQVDEPSDAKLSVTRGVRIRLDALHHGGDRRAVCRVEIGMKKAVRKRMRECRRPW